MLPKQRQDRSQRIRILFANSLSLVVLGINTIFNFILSLSESRSLTIAVLLSGAITAALMLLTMMFVKSIHKLSIIIPGLLIAGLLLELFALELIWTDRLAVGSFWIQYFFINVPYHLLLLLIGFIAVTAAYLDSKHFIRFVLGLNILLVAVGIGLYQMANHWINPYHLIWSWVLLLTIKGILYLMIRHFSTLYKSTLTSMTNFDTLLASMPNMVVLLDNEDHINFLSQSLANFVQIEDKNALVGHPFISIASTPEQTRVLTDALATTSDEPQTVSVYIDNELRFFQVQSIDMVGDVHGRLIEITDISALEQSRVSAEAASRAKSDFLAKMSHEIRTPLNAIMGMAELINREPVTDKVKGYAGVMKQSGAHLLSIINGLLDFSKIEVGKMEVLLGDYEFHSLINDVLSITQVQMGNKPIQFIAYVDPSIPNELYGDVQHLRQILLNVLSNASKYTKAGHFSLSVTHELLGNGYINLIFTVSDTGLGIRTKDLESLFDPFAQFDLDKNQNVDGSGLGLPITKSLIELMDGTIEVVSEYGKGSTFTIQLPQKVLGPTPVYQENKHIALYKCSPLYANSLIRSLDAMGITHEQVSNVSHLLLTHGRKPYDAVLAETPFLALVQSTVSKLSNAPQLICLSDNLSATTPPGLRTLDMPAWFLSIANSLNNTRFAFHREDQTLSFFHAPGARVLIVDDINTNLSVAKGLMADYGMTIDVCLSGHEAVEAVQSYTYDLVFMDYMMPEMNGIETTQLIRSLPDPYFQDLPIVALTANTVAGAREMFLRNGFDGFLSKPIDVNKLNSILVTWIPKAKRMPPLQQETSLTEDDTPAPTEIAIKGVDLAQGITFSGGTLEQYLETLEVFHEDIQERIPILQEALQTGDLELFTIVVHATKTAAANIGAAGLSEQAKALELVSKNQDLTTLSQRFTPFMDNLVALLNDVARHLPQTPSPQVTDFGDIKTSLQLLKTALAEFDATTIDAQLAYLKPFTKLADHGVTLSEILDNVFIGDYDPAAEQIDALCEKL